MYSKLDPEFPSHTTIGNSFGSMANMIEELRAWLAQREDYADGLICCQTLPREPM
jgi:hypothetical protein